MEKEAKPTAPAMATPFGDLTQMLEQFKVPGVDMSAFVEARRKDVAALAAANKAAFDGLQALARTQAEMLSESMQGLGQAAKGARVGAGGLPDAAAQAEIARVAWERMLVNMKTLAEMAQRTRAEALASLNGRVEENLAEVRQLLRSK